MHKSRRPYQLPGTLTCDASEVANGVSMELVKEYIWKHEQRFRRYEYLEKLYAGFHDVFKEPEKEDWKPDNRLAVNFPRYIVETFMGYSYGIPIKESHPDDKINEAVKEFCAQNDIRDHEFELLKKACIYGHAFEYVYQNERTQTKLAAINPKEMFVVYDDTLRTKALFAVRYGYHDIENGKTGKYGEILTRETIRKFDGEKLYPAEENPYGLIPCVEYKLNDERMGLFEGVAGLIEAYNHTLGEKANDVDAFADAYLAIIGTELDEDDVYRIRDNRIINLYGTDDAKELLVQFLQKPTADGTQENLLNRLEKLIYETSMVANISDETFGSSTSGTALAYKLQAMSNLAASFDRKVEKSIRKRYKIFCSLGTNVSDPDAYTQIAIRTARNLPKNLQEEAQTVAQLEGIVSKETQLSLLSVVHDVSEEIKKMKEEDEERQTSAVDRTMFNAE